MDTLKAVGQKWNGISLIVRILIGMIIGAILGLFFKDLPVVPFLGTLFVSALKAVAPILVFFLVLSALANAKAAGSMSTVIILYIVSTFIAAICAVIACSLFPIHLTLAEAVEQSSPQGIGEVFAAILTNCVANPVGALANGNFLGILVWAILLGIALRKASQGVKEVFAAIADAVNQVVRWVISFAPFGILGLVYSAVSENGLNIFIEYGRLILILVVVMFFIALVTNPILAFIGFRKNPYPLVLRCLKDSGITAFFTRSSAANIPVNMDLCSRLGLDKNFYSISIPLGATINMAGAAVTITVMAMAAAQTLGISVSPITAVILCALAALSACGASGVAGGSLLLIPLACSLFGINADIAMQMVAIGFIIGVIQDSCETALNSSSDVLFTATTEYRLWNKLGIEYTPGKDHEPVNEAAFRNELVLETEAAEAALIETAADVADVAADMAVE